MKRFAVAVALCANIFAAEPPAPPAARVTAVMDGVTCNYAPADAALARALAPLLAEQNHPAAEPTATASPASAAPIAALSIADFRQNRADYLARIAAAIGLEKPTALQEECYDGYLDNFERTDQILAITMEHARRQMQIRDITIAHKADLLRRLKAGEKIPGLSLDPDGEHGNAEWKPPETEMHDERIAELLKRREQGRLDLGYNLNTKDGVVDFSAETRLRRASASPPSAPTVPAAASAAAPAAVIPFPVIILPEDETLPPAELAAKIARGIGEMMAGLRHFQPAQFQDSAVLANLILHETTEIGIVDRYLASRDRRWLCEGVANHTAWKIARDRAGDAMARRVYDVDGQVAQSAALREKVDLHKWFASENQRKEDANTPLTRAHYAFAARAVFLMSERRGEDFLPKLFLEIGRTPRAKADMRTVEKAYRKLTGENLDGLLAAALLPLSAPKPASAPASAR